MLPCSRIYTALLSQPDLHFYVLMLHRESNRKNAMTSWRRQCAIWWDLSPNEGLFSEEIVVDSFFEFCFVLVYSDYVNSLISHEKCHPFDFKFVSNICFFCSAIVPLPELCIPTFLVWRLYNYILSVPIFKNSKILYMKVVYLVVGLWIINLAMKDNLKDCWV